MHKKIAITTVALSFAALGTSALAQQPDQQEQPPATAQEPPSTPQPPSSMDEQQPAKTGDKTLTGNVLGTHNDELYIEGAQGEVIAIKVTRETKLGEKQLSGHKHKFESMLRKELKTGEQVSVTFRVLKKGAVQENVAIAIQPGVA